jgi:RNA polymerase sigma-70 factor (ECF subfamily)
LKENEQILIQQLKEGNNMAYMHLYDKHYQVLCYFADQYVHDSFLAETIVCDVIFHIWEIREHLYITTSLRKYLMQSVRNRCLDYQKSQYVKKERTHAESPDQDFPALDYIKSDDYPLGNLLQSELEDVIREAVDRLPDECRRVFRLSRFEGKTQEEIAQLLGISTNTVKYHIKHALSLLRSDLSKYLLGIMLLFFGK